MVTARLGVLRLALTPGMRSTAQMRRVPAQQDLFLQGDEPVEMYGLIEGRVKLWRTGHDGSAITLLLLGPGEVLGAMAVAALPQPFSATAIDDVLAAT
jgi:CRP-like cAMP-binding protein